MVGRRYTRVWILAALLALLVMSGCVAADGGGTAAMPDDDMGEMAEEGYPDEMIIGMGALPVTLVGNTVPSLQSRIFSKLLYETLAETAAGREWARSIYRRARPGYHPISAGSIDRILGWEE